MNVLVALDAGIKGDRDVDEAEADGAFPEGVHNGFRAEDVPNRCVTSNPLGANEKRGSHETTPTGKMHRHPNLTGA